MSKQLAAIANTAILKNAVELTNTEKTLRKGLVVTAAWLFALGLSACGGGQQSYSSSSQQQSESSVATSSSSSSSSSEPDVGLTGDICIDGYQPHETNGMIGDSFDEWFENGEVDLTVQPTVYNYMYDNHWQDAHVLWHAVRRCPAANLGSQFPNPCDFVDLLPEENECAGAQDGLEFFAGHRLMMEQLMELWPDHAEQFTGWSSFPRTREDYPEQLRSYFSPWSQEILSAADIGDNIENYLHLFPTEGDLGRWIQCAIMPDQAFQFPNFSQNANLHFALHFNGDPQRNQRHSVSNTNVNIDSYLFWKLHGWIDNVWERYRAAKSKTRADADYKAEMLKQCREMDIWRKAAKAHRNGEPFDPNEPVDIPNEEGYFHQYVRPAFEDGGCTVCHGSGEQGGLRLGFNISSTDVVERLVNRDSAYAQGYKLVVPGKPEESWLYLKAAKQSTQVGVSCVGFTNCSQPMPPNGQGLSVEGLEYLRQWILNGAPVPTILP